MNILLLRTWLTNIGNGFIEMGAKTCIESAFPKSKIMEVSGFPNHIGYYNNLTVLDHLKSFMSNNTSDCQSSLIKKQFTLNIAELIDDIDLAILPGCVLDNALIRYLPTLKSIVDRNIPILFLGAGGTDYSPNTKKYVSDCLKQLKPIGFITRDEMAHETYLNCSKNTYSGIDCGFFISEYFSPPKTSKKYIVSTFDSMPEPYIDSSYPIMRAYHEPFNCTYIQNFSLRYPTETIQNCTKSKIKNIYKRENVLVSDLINDYLFLYANALEVHSDRVHACVAALSYGNSARFYAKTPRAALFERVLTSDIYNGMVSVDVDKLNEEKESQISSLNLFFDDY